MENLIKINKHCVPVCLSISRRTVTGPHLHVHRETHAETSKSKSTGFPLYMINGNNIYGGAHNGYFIFLGHLYIQYPVYMSCTVYMGISLASMF